MRHSALLLMTAVAATSLSAATPTFASTYETFTAKVLGVTPNGLIQLHDGSTIDLDKSVKIEGSPVANGDVTVTYSADENGYTYFTARFQTAPTTVQQN